jgi:cytochrome b6-f complex iron-sulfur subunit
MPPQAPAGKRSPEEIRAQREAFLAAKAAKAAGVAAAPAPKPEPAPTTAPAPVQPAAPKPVEAEKPAPKPKVAEAAPKPTPAKAAPVEEKPDPNLTRREFLNYAWLASIALFSLETVGLSLWFAFPNFKAGQFGGQFPIGEAKGALPEVNSGPKAYTDGKFWLVNLDAESPGGEPRKGVMAIYKVCTHLGCLYEWVPMTNRFECPCHGSKFALTGDYLAGPARRSLDRFVIQAVGPDGAVLAETNPDGEPLVLPSEDVQLVIDTGRRILGESVATPA